MRHLVFRFIHTLLVMSLAIILLPHTALAQQESLKLEADHFRIESTTPLEGFEFAITIKYQGYEARTFDLRASGPEGWTTYVTPSYGSTKISAIELQPNKAYPDRVKVTALPPAHIVPQPGEYRINLRCSDGAIVDSIELVAVVMPSYSMALTIFRDSYYNEMRAGEDNILSMSIQNTSSQSISNISFTSHKPAGWVISFKPEEIPYLDTGESQTIDISIRPDDDTENGDYQINVKAGADQITEQIVIRVSVEPSVTVWLWIGVTVLFIVIAAFIIVFIRFERRQAD